jgi:hypothetical protein
MQAVRAVLNAYGSETGDYYDVDEKNIDFVQLPLFIVSGLPDERCASRVHNRGVTRGRDGGDAG